jgi:hypothetical protein
MPNTNEKTDHSAQDLRELASRIRACADEFEKTASCVAESPDGSIPLAIDTFLTVLQRVESFKRTLERETIAFKANTTASKAKRRITASRKKKQDTEN